MPTADSGANYCVSEGYALNEAGEIIDGNDDLTTKSCTIYDTYDQKTYSFNVYGVSQVELISIEPVIRYRGLYGEAVIDDIGRLHFEIWSEDLDKITAGTTTFFDAQVRSPAEVSGLEDAEHFLSANAAFNITLNVGDYEVSLTLTGNRTALAAGDLSLTATYSLPDEEAQRSFTIDHNTATQTITITNEQEVTVTLTKPSATDSDSTAQVTLGVIMVGDEEVAKIVKRDSIILILYANGAVESI